MILDKIVKHKLTEVESRKESTPASFFKANLQQSDRSFKNALTKNFGIIAEIKRKSPSENKINLDVDVAKVAAIYSEKASAISVLTDEHFFGGSFENLKIAKGASSIPILCKDFIIDEYQIYEARHFGANAILLIAAILTEDQIEHFLQITKALGMDALVEVHNDEELQNVLNTKADIIGINNRNLKTFEIDLNTTLMLAKKIPDDKVKVSESGIKTKDDIEKVRAHVNAVLIGTAIMKSPNISKKIEEILG